MAAARKASSAKATKSTAKKRAPAKKTTAARKRTSAKKTTARKRTSAKKRAPAKPKGLEPAVLVAAFTEWRDFTLRNLDQREEKPLSLQTLRIIAAVAGEVLAEPDEAVAALLHLDRPRVGIVVLAVERDLRSIAERDEDLASSALAATALALARELDDENSATSKSMCARALVEAMDRIRELAPEKIAGDGIDELKAAREARRAAAAAAAQA